MTLQNANRTHRPAPGRATFVRAAAGMLSAAHRTCAVSLGPWVLSSLGGFERIEGQLIQVPPGEGSAQT